MQSMKIDKQDLPKPEPMGEEYGYGLSIHLEDSQVEKLGISGMEPGKKVKITALAEVKHVSISKDTNAKRHSMTLQITDMEAGAAPESNATADALYGK